jgi:hypothetical protein
MRKKPRLEEMKDLAQITPSWLPWELNSVNENLQHKPLFEIWVLNILKMPIS